MHKAVFLDRDGVINQKANEHDYIKTWNEFKLIPEIVDVMKHVQSKGYKIIIVTNQRGIARGIMTINDLNKIHENLRQLLHIHNIYITGIFYCSHDIHENCGCRKPKVGMFLKAKKLYNINFEQSFLIGDSLTDIMAANTLKIKSILYAKNAINKKIEPMPRYIVTDLNEINKIIN
ncbi:HAD family hydrolase [Alkaliphilus sp. MSJ-5]|uniref:D,D-heptose 1,7-bisphosphate phosphatase n=1 Tax=Alkaliphilus flagellatus TaxID=2841507 RepID=A0ABS6FXX5_9FIRM|nr:HAD family hydrolase [Alkaliphilus flagellatus]MBU5675081.1 HAD family hydrolase [Alkaliphilus flagellatus]